MRPRILTLGTAVILLTACLVAPADAAEPSWTIDRPPGDQDCLDVTYTARTFTLTWTTARDPACAPKVAYDRYFYDFYEDSTADTRWRDNRDNAGPSVTVTVPNGVTRFHVETGAADNTGHWFPRDDLTIFQTSDEPNRPPVVSAGPDRTLRGTSTAVLAATVTDDGKPAPPRLTSRWSQVSGPATAIFTPPMTVTFPVAGTYVLRLTGNDGALTASDDVTVTVIEHYRVDVRAWIPHAFVVDPVHPTPEHRMRNSVDSWSACGSVVGPLTQVSSFRGDNHRAFDGTYRAREWAEFDWDGTRTSNLTKPATSGEYGPTHRDFVLTPNRDRDGTQRPPTVCTVTETATHNASVTTGARNTVSIEINAANPLVFPAPAIDDDLTIQFVARNQIAVNARTDTFPNHGVRITRNGATLYTNVLNDASCVQATGIPGAVNLLNRLRQQNNRRTDVVVTTAPPRSLTATCVR